MLIAETIFQAAMRNYFKIDKDAPVNEFHLFKNTNYRIFVSFFELFDDNCCDLLNDRATLSIMEDVFGVSQVVGLKMVECSNEEELLKMIELGASFRKTRSTFKNDTSSRSHAICQIRVKNLGNVADEDGILNLVDLAGSEVICCKKIDIFLSEWR